MQTERLFWILCHFQTAWEGFLKLLHLHLNLQITYREDHSATLSNTHNTNQTTKLPQDWISRGRTKFAFNSRGWLACVNTASQCPINPWFPENSSALCKHLPSVSQAGNTKTMETARMWHREILLSRLVSLFLNKALHGVSSVHECYSLSLSLCVSPSLSSLFSPLCTCYFSTVPGLFSSLCVLPACLLCLCFPCFPLLFCSFSSSPPNPATDIVWKPLFTVWSDRWHSDFGYYYPLMSPQRVCWAYCCSVNLDISITFFGRTNFRPHPLFARAGRAVHTAVNIRVWHEHDCRL